MSTCDGSNSRTRTYADGPPWVFKGRAFYQLHLVKAEVARRFIPSELKIVQAFGYTLGGFYLAHYDSSPAGVFDELVVLAGIVWNPPTSCAWAARVLVNSREACDHGIQEVGLPSRTADFRLRTCPERKNWRRPWWNILPKFCAQKQGKKCSSNGDLGLEILETDRSIRRPLCHIEINNGLLGAKEMGWPGPFINLSLPSFSGKTKQQPDLLQYSCNLNCRVRPVSMARVSSLEITEDPQTTSSGLVNADILAVLTGKPLFSIAFLRMVMQVDAPTLVITKTASKTQEEHGLLYARQEAKVPSLPADATL